MKNTGTGKKKNVSIKLEVTHNRPLGKLQNTLLQCKKITPKQEITFAAEIQSALLDVFN